MRGWQTRLVRLQRALTAPEIFFGACAIALELGLGKNTASSLRALLIFDVLILSIFASRLVVRAVTGWRRVLRPSHVSGALAVTVLWVAVSPRAAAGVALIHDGYHLGRWLWAEYRQRTLNDRVWHRVGLRPARSLVFSFIALICIGTVCLWLPAASASGDHVSLVDAFFTAVSATCVTGLVTLDTAVAWSPFGTGVIFALFQLGALGIMVVSGAMALALGETLGGRRGVALRGVLDETDTEKLTSLVKTVVVATLAVEAVGAAVLFVRFVSMGMEPHDAAVHAVFHSVSAFCNAGFSLNTDSLVAYGADPAVSLTIVVLITLGGLGFGVMIAVFGWLARGGRGVLSVHSKLVLATSAGLVGAGALGYFFFEFDRSLAPLGLGGKLLAALFQSVTARTAGFNSVPLGDVHPVTVLLLCGLMFIGASPGSTGGGIKTTTFALIFLTARAFLRERQEVEVFGRRIPQGQVIRAMALTGGAVLSGALGFGALLVTEQLPFEKLAFETASALGTAGLSLGITAELSTPGRLVVACLMFVGRVGPLTAAAALASRRGAAAGRITVPEGKVLVG